MLRGLSLLIVILSLTLAACSPAATPTPTVPSPTAAPTVTATVAPTSTPAPAAPEHNLTEGCVPEGQYDPSIDYFPEKVTLTHAENLTVEYHNHYKVVTIAIPWPGAAESLTYVLVQCGTPRPEGFREEQIIDVPIDSLITMSTTYLPFLDAFGVLDRLVGLDDATFVHNPTVLQMAAEGKLATIGYGAGVNVEQVLELAPDIVMTYGSGMLEYDAHPVLLQAGQKVVINAEWLDTTPLGRAEWGKFIALFFNEEVEAEALFNQTLKRYEELKALTANISGRPTVFSGLPYQGTWYVPGGRSFAATFFRDAGAEYLWSDDDSTGSVPLSFEAVFERAREADFWLNLGFVSTLEAMKESDVRYADFKAFQTGNVWNYDARMSPNGGNDYFESAVAYPEVVLADLIKIFHPDLLPDHELVYYRQVK